MYLITLNSNKPVPFGNTDTRLTTRSLKSQTCIL
uniref:Uncharacterized protein n=1 Tax=Anguilla anguilla TaxID=7936 RepID=A0A0E9WH56_ANGAN